MPVAPAPAVPPDRPRLAPDRGEAGVAAVLAAAVLLAVWPAVRTAADPAEPAVPVAYRLDVNAAAPAELAVLRGVGPVLAGRIAADRAARGPFRHGVDLLAVRGVGPKTLDRLTPHLRFPLDDVPAGGAVAAR